MNARWLLAAWLVTGMAHANLVGLDAATPAASETRTAPILTEWTHQGGGIAFLFAGAVTLDTPKSPPQTELAVGAQLNAY